jgi:WD40 repeat protein/tetratricopeptide (TPR) repeat protein/predicted Ser/Thr protein kinase
MSRLLDADTAEHDREPQVDKVCTAFEKAWQAGQRPEMEEYLRLAPEAVRPALLRELILLEVEYRRRAGEEPRPAEYRQRFPEHDDLIATLFHSLSSPPAAGSPAAETPPSVTGPYVPAADTGPSTLPKPVLPQAPPGPGRVLGDYELLEELGKGGMGVVYKARQRSAHRLVALKVIRADCLEGVPPEQHKEWLRRFHTEAQASARIEHEHVVTVHEVGESAGQLFYSMRYVEGQSLADLLRDGPLPGRKAATFLEAVARAVHYAHTCGILHRDLKPRNILVDKSDQPYVADFGLAKVLAAGAEALTADGQTQTGAVLGTPSYMAPEQALDAAHVTTASDVYSLGATLYALITGRPPFQAATLAETLHQVIYQEAVPPRQLNPAIDRDLETIALKCLHKEPGRRYGSAMALAEDLRCYLDGRPIQARPVGRLERTWRWCKRNRLVAGLLALVVVVLLAGAGVASFFAFRASWNASQAQLNEQTAKENEAAAKKNARETRLQLVRLHVATGLRHLDEGDMLGAFSWLTEAFNQDEKDAVREEMHRFRLGAVLAKCPQLTQLWFHAAAVNDVEYSPDGQNIVVACADGTVALGDSVTGKEKTGPLRNPAMVNRAHFSGDGRRVVTACADGTAHLWDATTGVKLAPVLHHAASVNDARFSPDGRQILTVSADLTARLWDAQTGKPLTKPLKHGGLGVVHHGSFSPDGKWVVTTSGDQGHRWAYGETRIWEAATGRPVCLLPADRAVFQATFNADGSRVLTATEGGAVVWDVARKAQLLRVGDWSGTFVAAYSPDGTRFVTANGDTTARLFDAANGTPVTSPMKHESGVEQASFSPDGRQILTVSGDTVRVWHAATGELALSPLKEGRQVARASFSPDGRCLVVAAWNTVRVWDLARPLQPPLALPHGKATYRATFSPDGSRVITCSHDHTARVWDAVTGQPILPPLQHNSNVMQASFSPDGGRAVTASWDRTAQVWDLATGKKIGQAMTHQDDLFHAEFSPDGQSIITASKDQTARVWDAATGQPLTEPLQHKGIVKHACFSPVGTLVATASADGTARVWDAATGKPITGPLRHQQGVNSALFSADGRLLITASDDGTAQVWDPANGTKVSAPLKHNGKVLHATFASDNRRVVTSGADGTARIWDATTSLPLAPPLKHAHVVQHVAFSPDGRRVVTASMDYTARVWDAATGEPVGPPLKTGFDVQQAVFDPRGRCVVTAGTAGAAYVWDLPMDNRPLDDLVLLAQLLSGHRLDPGAGRVPLEPEALRAVWDQLRAKYPHEFVALEVGKLMPQYRQDLALGHQLRGDLLRSAARPKEAEENYLKAAALFRQLTKDAPANQGYLMNLGHLHWRLGASHVANQHLHEAQASYRQALVCFEKVAFAAPDDPFNWQELAESHVRLGEVLLWTGRLGDAEKALERAEEILHELSLEYPNERLYPDRRYEAGALLLKVRQQAVGQDSLIMAWFPFHAEAYHDRGTWHGKLRKGDKALADQNLALALNPRLPGAYYQRGLVALGQGQPQKALADFNQAVLLQPDDVEACDSLARLYVLGPPKLRAPDRALPLAQRAVQLDAHNAELSNTLGVVYYRLAKYQDAVKAFEHAVKLRGKGTSFDLFFLAQCHHLLGETGKSQKEFEQAIAWQKTADLAPYQVQELTIIRAETEAALGRPPGSRGGEVK